VWCHMTPHRRPKSSFFSTACPSPHPTPIKATPAVTRTLPVVVVVVVVVVPSPPTNAVSHPSE